MRHLIDTTDFTIEEIEEIFDKAKLYLNNDFHQSCKDKIIITIFFENSTRTKSSFEIAAKRLGAQVVNLDVSSSSQSKGETIFDTVANLNAMNPDAIIIRHKESFVPLELSKNISTPMINAGDGNNAHPTQALLDLFTIRQYYPDLNGKKIAIVGDIKNSRVASSNIRLFSRFGLEVILVAPLHFKSDHNLRHVQRVETIIDEVDIIMSLRTQTERHENSVSLEEHGKNYCITKELVKDRDIIIIHPGPVHRNIDISDEMLEDSRCKVLEQVTNGVAIRMAVLDKLLG